MIYQANIVTDKGAANNAKAAPDKDAVNSRLAELHLLFDASDC